MCVTDYIRLLLNMILLRNLSLLINVCGPAGRARAPNVDTYTKVDSTKLSVRFASKH